MNLSDRLFYSASQGDFFVDSGQSIGGLYAPLSDEDALNNHLTEALSQAGLTDNAIQEKILRIYWDNCTLYEKQGFLNGLRFGANLTRELLL